MMETLQQQLEQSTLVEPVFDGLHLHPVTLVAHLGQEKTLPHTLAREVQAMMLLPTCQHIHLAVGLLPPVSVEVCFSYFYDAVS